MCRFKRSAHLDPIAKNDIIKNMPVDPILAIDLKALDAYQRHLENPLEKSGQVRVSRPSSDAAYEVVLSKESQAQNAHENVTYNAAGRLV